MLNYLGPNFGPSGPITNVLPPATPGTIPDGVPGIPSTPAPLPPPPTIHHGHHGGHASAHALAAILKSNPGPMGAPVAPPPPPEYGTTTQEDGSILLHRRNPDGSLGPVVKVIPPIRTANTPGK